MVAPGAPAGVTVHPPLMAKEVVTPAHVMVTPVTAVAAVPVLLSVSSFAAPVTEHVGEADVPPDWNPAAVRASTVTETWAELDAEPKMPKTKPPIATAAIRVTAMMSTVAMMGEMAFLPYFPIRIFIGELSEPCLV